MRTRQRAGLLASPIAWPWGSGGYPSLRVQKAPAGRYGGFPGSPASLTDPTLKWSILSQVTSRQRHSQGWRCCCRRRFPDYSTSCEEADRGRSRFLRIRAICCVLRPAARALQARSLSRLQSSGSGCRHIPDRRRRYKGEASPVVGVKRPAEGDGRQARQNEERHSGVHSHGTACRTTGPRQGRKMAPMGCRRGSWIRPPGRPARRPEPGLKHSRSGCARWRS